MITTEPSDADAQAAHMPQCLDDEAAERLAHEVIDLVFAQPPHDVVLDLTGVEEICPRATDTLRRAHLALADHEARLILQCPTEIEQQLLSAFSEFDVVHSDA